MTSPNFHSAVHSPCEELALGHGLPSYTALVLQQGLHEGHVVYSPDPEGLSHMLKTLAWSEKEMTAGAYMGPTRPISLSLLLSLAISQGDKLLLGAPDSVIPYDDRVDSATDICRTQMQ